MRYFIRLKLNSFQWEKENDGDIQLLDVNVVW